MGEKEVGMKVDDAVDDEEVYVRETKTLEGMDIDDREEYVYGVIEEFAKVVKGIGEEKSKIKQLRRWKKLGDELTGEKGEEIVICALYGVKKKYRPLFVVLLAIVTGIDKKILIPDE